MRLSPFFKSLFNKFFPDSCFLCKALLLDPQSFCLCKSCEARFSFRLQPLFPNLNGCDECYILEDYEKLKPLLKAVKFRGNQKILNYLSKKIEKALCLFLLPEDTVIIPTPLHAKRLKKRGFNQVSALFQPFLNSRKLKFSQILQRTQSTDHLFDKRPLERRFILRSAFSCTGFSERDTQRPVLLLDDILTSGATLEAQATCLRDAGFSSIRVLCLAYSQKKF